jgi:hypothetical protein
MRARRRYVVRGTIAAIVLGLAGAPLVAHEVTFKGTVLTAAPTSLKVNVVDEKTKKPKVMTFEIDKETKILRGDKLVIFAEARIQKDEPIAVTVNLDDGEDLANVIRLEVRK